MSLPEAFIVEMETVLGKNGTECLCRALEEEAPVSVRCHPRKPAKRPEGRPVPWCAEGLYLDRRPSFTLDPFFQGGAYYVQEAGSMLLEQVFRQAVGEAPEGLTVLDLCAAPGGKTTHLSALAGPGTLVVANEVIRSRTAVLKENVRKWGLGNVAVTRSDPAGFSRLPGFFDVVVADAPCSGEGMFRKTPAAREEWSLSHVALCAARQQRILADAWEALRPGGTLIYSTCTFNRAENEDQLRWLAREYGAAPVEVTADPAWGVEVTETEGIRGFRCWPHRTRSEGFFIAAVRKPGEEAPRKGRGGRPVLLPVSKAGREAVSPWLRQPDRMALFDREGTVYACEALFAARLEALAARLDTVHFGTEVGQFFHGRLKPAHGLALSCGLAPGAVPSVNLPLEEALDYLRKKEVPAARFREGFNLAAYEGLPLGFVKRIGVRCNNLYPKESRIFNL